MEIAERTDRRNLFSLTNTWVLCTILLVFASVYGFSFERASSNSTIGVDAQAVTGGNEGEAVMIKAQEMLVYLLCFACILPISRPVWRQVRGNALIFSVIGWAILSVAWSDMPSTSAFNSLRMGTGLVLVIYLFERYSANEIQKLLMMVGCIAATGSIFMALALPQYGIQSRGDSAMGAWQGIFGQKNLCGFQMLLLLLPAFFVKLNGTFARGLRIGYVLVVLFVITMTQSVGAFVTGCLCLVFVGLLKITTRMPRKDAALIVLGLLAAGAVTAILALTNFNALMYALGKDPTMTGRTVLWAGLAHLAMKRPLCGYGYTAFWQGIVKGPTRSLSLQMGWLGLAYAENGVLELLLELGLVGLLLYALIFLRAAKDALYCMGREAKPAVLWYVTILFYVVVTNIEGGSLLYPTHLGCILPFLAFVGLRREAKQMSERLAV